MKPQSKDEAELQRKFKEEDESNYETGREYREARRVWKRKAHKLQRAEGKKQLQKQIRGIEE